MTASNTTATAAAVRAPSTVALAVVAGVGPFATDTYLAGLPDLRESLHTTAAVAQLTLTAFIAGLAMGQLLLGALSDALGRRGLLLVTTSAFTLLTAGCAMAPTGPLLVVARLLEGLAAGGGIVVARAVITDSYEGRAAAVRFGTIASLTVLGPIVAPALGGLVLTFGTWRAVFAGISAFGVLMVVAVAVGVPESLPVERRHPPGLRQIGARLADLARDWSFMRHVAVYCFAAAGFFSYIGGSVFVLRTAFGVGSGTYSMVFATNAAAMAGTSALFRAFVARTGPARLRSIGITTSTCGAVGLLATAVFVPDAPLALPWVLFCVVVAGTGLTLPATTALAQEAGRRSAGTASSLQGGLGFLTGALVAPLTGFIGYQSLLPLALAMTVFYLASSGLLRVISHQRGC